MAALQIHWSLKILCLCINAIVGSYTNWGRLHGNSTISWSFQKKLHILPSDHFSIYFTLQTHLSYKPFKISIHALLHTFIPPTLLKLSSSKLLRSPFYLGTKRSHPLSWISYFKMTSFITPLSGYHALTSPLHSNISDSILSLIVYQLVGHFTCNYLTQSIL